MADPTVIQCDGACTVTVDHVITLNVPVLNLTVEQGFLIGGAILLVWAIAYSYRQVGRQISSAGANLPEE